MLAEGLNVFRVGVNASLLGKSLAESRIRLQTGCNVIATSQDGKMVINPDPSVCLLESSELIVIGTDEAEKRFFKMYSDGGKLKSS